MNDEMQDGALPPVMHGEAEKQIATVVGMVRAAMAELQAQKTTDLQRIGLQAQVDALCAMYGRLHPSDAELLRPRLGSLMSALDDLGARLQAARDEVGAQLGQSRQTQTAHRAYATSQAQGQNPPPPDAKEDGDG